MSPLPSCHSDNFFDELTGIQINQQTKTDSSGKKCQHALLWQIFERAKKSNIESDLFKFKMLFLVLQQEAFTLIYCSLTQKTQKTSELCWIIMTPNLLRSEGRGHFGYDTINCE